MYPEEVYSLNWSLPRELMRPIAFDLARGLIKDTLKFPKAIRVLNSRVLEVEGYESHYIVCKDICWWVKFKFKVLQHILMTYSQTQDGRQRGCYKYVEGYKYVYLK